MLSEKLKEFTQHNHQLLEKKLVMKIKLVNNVQDYARLLQLFYGFFGGLELAIDSKINPLFLPDYATRRKSAALAIDLVKMQTTLPVRATSIALPNINNHFDAMGALYVVEGSTLGGNFIAQMLTKQAPALKEFSFFIGYGNKTQHMWQLFKQSLDEPLEYAQAQMVIEGANDTFLHFSNWFDQHYLS